MSEKISLDSSELINKRGHHADDVLLIIVVCTLSDERKINIIQHTAVYYPFTQFMRCLVSEVCPIAVVTYHSDNRHYGSH